MTQIALQDYWSDGRPVGESPDGVSVVLPADSVGISAILINTTSTTLRIAVASGTATAYISDVPSYQSNGYALPGNAGIRRRLTSICVKRLVSKPTWHLSVLGTSAALYLARPSDVSDTS